MKLTSIKPEAQGYYSREPMLSITRSRTFVLNKAAVSLLGLGAGDYIDFLWDEDNPRDWYCRKHSSGYELRAPSDSGSGLHFGSSSLYFRMVESVGLDTMKSYQVLISKQELKLDDIRCYAVVTSSAKPVKRKLKP